MQTREWVAHVKFYFQNIFIHFVSLMYPFSKLKFGVLLTEMIREKYFVWKALELIEGRKITAHSNLVALLGNFKIIFKAIHSRFKTNHILFDIHMTYQSHWKKISMG